MATTTVEDGDCAVSIAAKLGFRSYRTLWDANTPLHSTRPNPNMLVIDDVLTLPEKVQTVPGNTATRIRIVVPKLSLPSLRLVLLTAVHKPLSGAAWEVANPAHSGTTAATGLVEIKNLPPDLKQIVLKVTPKAPDPLPPVMPSTTGTPTIPPYPAPIKPAEFEDKLRASDPSDLFVEWTLKIGSMPSFNHESGVVGRLQNLGGPIDAGARTERTVKAYQKAHLNQDAGSGVPADIQEDLRDRHDTPGGKS